jgi:hypothetical protein
MSSRVEHSGKSSFNNPLMIWLYAAFLGIPVVFIVTGSLIEDKASNLWWAIPIAYAAIVLYKVSRLLYIAKRNRTKLPSESQTKSTNDIRFTVDIRLAGILCIDLIIEARRWGESRGFGATWMEESPQYDEIRQIGEAVNDAKGLNGMVQVIQEVRQNFRYGYLLDHFWDGIGDWHA